MPLRDTRERPIKKALYYPTLQRLTYYVTNEAVQTIHQVATIEQARAAIKDVATGFREIVQVLEIVPITKI